MQPRKESDRVVLRLLVIPGCPEIPSDSLHIGDASFLVDVLWPLLVAEDGFVQEEITVFVVSETHDKTFK